MSYFNLALTNYDISYANSYDSRINHAVLVEARLDCSSWTWSSRQGYLCYHDLLVRLKKEGDS